MKVVYYQKTEPDYENHSFSPSKSRGALLHEGSTPSSGTNHSENLQSSYPLPQKNVRGGSMDKEMLMRRNGP